MPLDLLRTSRVKDRCTAQIRPALLVLLRQFIRMPKNLELRKNVSTPFCNFAPELMGMTGSEFFLAQLLFAEIPFAPIKLVGICAGFRFSSRGTHGGRY